MLNECRNDAVAVKHDVKEYYEIALEAQQAEASETQGHDIGAQDCFRASFDVEKNPTHVVLHYGHMPRTSTGEEHDEATLSPEARLKRAVLRASEARDITGAVGSLGMGGVGKSCALRGLAADEDVRRRFLDGVYMMVLGDKASKVDVVKGVSDMVKHSGGRKLAQDMWKERGDLREVLSRAGVWFQSRRILLLVDDVWENGEVRSSIVGQLHGSVVSGQSRLAFTTRHARLASEYETVKFSKRDQMVSREILLKAAGASVGSTKSFEGVVDGVLELCAGLPLALAIAGKNVAVRFRYLGARSWRKAWAEARAAIRSRRNRLVVKSDYDYDKHSLEDVCKSSLETLEGGKRGRLGFEPKLSVHEMYRSLVIQKKQAAVPVGVLCRLWSMDDECDAVETMNMFVEVSLAEHRSVTLNGEDMTCLSLHDLLHDVVQVQCKEPGEEKQHHRKVLDGWCDGAGPSREVRRQAKRDWSGSEAFDDEYMRNNLSRHLVSAGLGSELRGLLRNPRWTAERLRRREMLGLEEDFGFAIASVEAESGVEERRGSEERERWGLKMICGAARLSASFVVRNPGEVWFQLRGRLLGLAEKCGVIREFVEEIDVYAERPWARPVGACLSEPGGRVLSMVQCAGRVMDMQRGGREGEMLVCGVVDGMGFMCSVVNGEMEEEEVFVNKKAEGRCECRSVGEEEGVVEGRDEGGVSGGCSGSCVEESAGVEWSAVRSVRYTADGDRVATRHENGTVRMWDGASGEAMGGPFGGYGEECEWSADGGRVVCGGKDGSVRIWDGVSGGAVGGDEHAHSDYVSCVKWSADGSRVVSGGFDGSVRMWDGATGEVMGVHEHAHSQLVSCIKWSADGSRFLSGGRDGSVRIWDGASGEVMGVREHAHSQLVSCIKWSADGRRFASCGGDGSVRIWDGTSGEVVGGDKRAHRVGVKFVEWSADGSRFVSGGWDGSVRIWNGARGEAVGGDERAHGGGVNCVEWSGDGSRIVSGGFDGSVRMWDGASGGAVGGHTRAHRGRVGCVKWLADGRRFVSGGKDGSVRIWDGASGEVVGRDGRTHRGGVNCVKWSADGSRFVSGGRDGSVRIWDGASGEATGGDKHAHGWWVTRIEWSAHGSRFMSVGGNGSVRIWDVASGDLVGGDEYAHRGGVHCVKWSTDGSRVVTSGSDGSVRIWNGESGAVVRGYERAHRERVICVKWSANRSRVLSGGKDGSVRIWDGASGDLVGGDEVAHRRGVNCVKWSADGSRVVSGGKDGSVRIWNGASGKVVGGHERAHGGSVVCVMWSADGGRVVSGGKDGSVRIWNGASGNAVGGYGRAHGGGVVCVKWSADGSRVVSGGKDGSVRIWNGASGKVVGGHERAHGGGVVCVMWSADGGRVVSGGKDGSVRIWNGASGEVVGGAERVHDVGVRCVEWSPDGSRIVSGGKDGSVRIWDGGSGKAVGGDEHAHGTWVIRIEWSADGSRVVSSGSDGSVKMWDGASGKAIGMEPEPCQTRPAKQSHSCPDVGSVNAAGLTSARNYGGEQATRPSAEEYGAGHWVAFGRSLELWCGGRKVLLATFEADHRQRHGVEFRNMKSAVVLGLLQDRSMYRVEIVK